jgi:prolyl 4-hydroxylase
LFCFVSYLAPNFLDIFIHFEPTGHSLRHGLEEDNKHVDTKYREALERGHGGHENDNHGLPSYVIQGSAEESHWRQQHPESARNAKMSSFTTGSTSAHQAAQNGDVVALEAALKADKNAVHAKDENGWNPIHEAARGGHLDVVKALLNHGADINAKTDKDGSTALYWAKHSLEGEHPMISYLEELGALEVGPEL